MTKESLHAKTQIIGARSPNDTEPTKPITQGALTAIKLRIKK